MSRSPRLALLGTLLTALAVAGPLGCGDSGTNSNSNTNANANGNATDAAQPPAPIDVTGPVGRIDFAYTLALADEDPTGEVRTYSISTGALPLGLTLASDGTVSGTPTASGVHEIEIQGEGACGDVTCRLVVRLTIEVLPVILLSGYGPFAGVPENPSWAAVAPLHEQIIGGYDVRTIELTVTWDNAWAAFELEYEHFKPAIAIGAGVAMGELVIRLEALAQNYAQGQDVDGINKNEPIDPTGDDWDSGLPLADLRDLLQNEGYPVAISNNAGTYLCNYLFYNLMRHVALEPAAARVLAGFVHVPGEDVVSIPDMTDAWELMLGYLTTYRESLQRTRHLGDRPYEATVTHAPRYLYPRTAPAHNPR